MNPVAISCTSQRRCSLYAEVLSKSHRRRFHGNALHVLSIVVLWLTASACSEGTHRGDRTTAIDRPPAQQRPAQPQIVTRLTTTLSEGRTVFWPIRHNGHVACRHWKVRRIKGYKNQGRLIHSFDNFGERQNLTGICSRFLLTLLSSPGEARRGEATPTPLFSSPPPIPLSALSCHERKRSP